MAVSLYISVTQNSQNISNNTSNVTVKLSVSWTYGSYNQLQKSGWVKIDGTTYNFTSSFNYNATTSGSEVIYTKTLDITHGSDGTKNLSVSASYTTGVSSGTITASMTQVLTTIPRVSTLSVANGTLNTAQTLTVTRQSTSFTHTITATCGSASQTICSKATSTSISFTPPLSWASQNTTGTKVTVTYKITTYNGSTSIGSKSYSKTCSIPSSVVPTCTLSITDPTGYLSTYGSFLKGLSTCNVTVNATPSYSSPITSYITTVNGSTYTSSSFTTGVLKTDGTLTISTTVKDQRGRSGSANTSITVLTYSNPKISSLNIYRCDSSGNYNNQGEYVKVVFSATVTSLNSKNSAIYKLQYKKSSDSSYTTVDLSSYTGNYSVSNGSYMFAANSSNSYDISIIVTDNFKSITRSGVAPTGFTLMNFHSSGTGLGIGKVAETENLFDVGLYAYFQNGVAIPTNNTAYNGMTTDDLILPLMHVDSGNNSDFGYGSYVYKIGATNLMGLDVNIYSSAASSYYRPYIRAGDSIEITAFRTAGYVTGAGTDVYFWIPLTKYILGSVTITAVSTTGFTLRQNGIYTHGSSASNPIQPDSYSVAFHRHMGIRIGAIFSDTTNVTNNDTIGITWGGTLTFS